MMAAQPRLSVDRRPLQPVNQPAATKNLAQPKPCTEISVVDTSNKENFPHFCSTPIKKVMMESEAETIIDPSIADEMSATRERLERLRCEEVRTEKVLRERGMMLDLEMKEILNRGETQKQLELEVDRLYRLKEIKLTCMRISRLRSLRGKEEEKKMKQDQVNKGYIYIQGRESLHMAEEIN